MKFLLFSHHDTSHFWVGLLRELIVLEFPDSLVIKYLRGYQTLASTLKNQFGNEIDNSRSERTSPCPYYNIFNWNIFTLWETKEVTQCPASMSDSFITNFRLTNLVWLVRKSIIFSLVEFMSVLKSACFWRKTFSRIPKQGFSKYYLIFLTYVLNFCHIFHYTEILVLRCTWFLFWHRLKWNEYGRTSNVI